MGWLEALISRFGPGVVIDMIKKTPWRKMGKEQAKPFDTFLDSQFKEKRSEALQKEIVKACDEYYAGFREGLLEDQKN